ncbi:hypothetical protein Scep_017620 [Stephania cephalantha]|uniref:Uncharacterized protein n=1 Tax=Stephania cephalantha TaxID=152367 RepID=A0AAP0NTQ5_9MAGN
MKKEKQVRQAETQATSIATFTSILRPSSFAATEHLKLRQCLTIILLSTKVLGKKKSSADA